MALGFSHLASPNDAGHQAAVTSGHLASARRAWCWSPDVRLCERWESGAGTGVRRQHPRARDVRLQMRFSSLVSIAIGRTPHCCWELAASVIRAWLARSPRAPCQISRSHGIVTARVGASGAALLPLQHPQSYESPGPTLCEAFEATIGEDLFRHPSLQSAKPKGEKRVRERSLLRMAFSLEDAAESPQT
jgi:hypothetical protein